MGINPVILPLFNQLITNVNTMTRLTNANVQALQSQGVATVSNKLTQRDKTTLQAAAGVEEKDDFTLSTVYDALIGEEGKTEERFQRELVNIFSKGDEDVRIHVTATLTKDMRKVNLCENGSKLVSSMHRGLTIFAVLSKEFAQIHAEDERQQRYESASHHTMADVEKLESGLQLVLPTNYDGVLKALNNYDILLKEAIGGDCPHWKWLKKLIKAYKRAKMALEPVIDLRKGLILLWNIHVDSRDFFLECVKWSEGDDLPQSRLKHTVSSLENEMVCRKDTMPMEAILQKYAPGYGQSRAETEDEGATSSKSRSAITKPQRNSKIPVAVKSVVAKLRTQEPEFCFATLAALKVKGCDYQGLNPGKRGSCIDYGLFGYCPNYKRCSYDHVIVNPPDAKTKQIVKNLEKGLEALSM
jgi:hypothetical protein